jgi:hypothetical protein
VAGLGPARQLTVVGGAPRRDRGGDAAQRQDGPVGQVGAADAGRRHEQQAVHARRELDRDLRGDVAAHRVADQLDDAEAELLAERVHGAPVARDRDRVARHRRQAEAGQVERDHAPLLGGARDVLEPVLPLAAEPVDEHHRLARTRPDVDVVDRLAVDLDLVQVRRPVDRAPVGLGGGAVAVVRAAALPDARRSCGGDEILGHRALG